MAAFPSLLPFSHIPEWGGPVRVIQTLFLNALATRRTVDFARRGVNPSLAQA